MEYLFYKERFEIANPDRLVEFNLMDRPALEPFPPYDYRYIFITDEDRFVLRYHINSLEFVTAYKKLEKATEKYFAALRKDTLDEAKIAKRWNKVKKHKDRFFGLWDQVVVKWELK